MAELFNSHRDQFNLQPPSIRSGAGRDSNSIDSRISIEKLSAMELDNLTPDEDYDDIEGEMSDISSGYAHRTDRLSTNFHGIDMDLSLREFSRQNRTTESEMKAREEMYRECTFQPQIKTLPGYYGNKESNAAFLDRVNKWSKDRENQIKKRAAQIEKEKDEECTFTPTLYKGMHRRNSSGGSNSYQSQFDVGERLHHYNNAMSANKFRLIELERKNEEEKVLKECTFKPKMETKMYKNVNSHVKKYVEEDNLEDKSFTSMHSLKSAQSEAKFYEECTFNPQINKIKPTMSNAKSYVSVPLVDRLTKSAASSIGKNSNDENLSLASNISMYDKFSNSSVSNASVLNKSVASNLSTAERQKQFDDFLNRQKKTIKHKEATVKDLEEKVKPSFQPTLCKKSVEIVSSEFSERLDKDLAKRTSTTKLEDVVKEVTKEYTFKPKINAVSEKLPARSCVEMSIGDSFRHGNKIMTAQALVQQKEMDASTYRPNLATEDYNRKYETESGRTAITKPEEYLAWQRQVETEKQKVREEIIKKREEQELADCTFKPQTIDCPAYVKRIAKSMQALKAQTPPKPPSKPDWR